METLLIAYNYYVLANVPTRLMGLLAAPNFNELYAEVKGAVNCFWLGYD